MIDLTGGGDALHPEAWLAQCLSRIRTRRRSLSQAAPYPLSCLLRLSCFHPPLGLVMCKDHERGQGILVGLEM